MLYTDNLRVYCTVLFILTLSTVCFYFVKVTFEYAEVAVALRNVMAVGVRSVCEVRPRTVLARTVAVAAMVVVANVVADVAVTVVLRRGPSNWLGVALGPATVGKMDDTFVIAATLLTTGGSTFVPGMVCNTDGMGLHMCSCEGPRMASRRYATRDPAVRPILYDNVIMFPGIKHHKI